MYCGEFRAPAVELAAAVALLVLVTFSCQVIWMVHATGATPAGHVRPTYRNFFPPDARWQFSGIRLAKDAPA